MSKLIKIALIIAALAAVSVYLYVFHKPHKNTFNLKPEFVVSAEQLFNDFDLNEEEANAKYLGKIIQVEGNIVKIKKISQSYEISLFDEIFGVTCLIDSIYAVQQTKEIEQLNKGNRVKIKGQCNGYLGDVKLDRCIIVN